MADCNQERLLHKLIVAFVCIDTTLGWHNDSVDVAIIRGVIEPGCSTQNIGNA